MQILQFSSSTPDAILKNPKMRELSSGLYLYFRFRASYL